jgi:hypothetical protein
MCKHPEKVAYHTLRGAAQGAWDILTMLDSPQRPYECECGAYHLTTKGMNGGPLTADMVRFLADSVGIDTKEKVA